ncbi:MAG: DNA replication/repair protein RecF [Alphaproteobacteria bacterium]
MTVARLTLTNFRCFGRAVIEADERPVVLTGANGAGKTSVLEALSMLTPGPGLRGARLADLTRREAGDSASWAVAAEAHGFAGPVTVGTGAVAGDARRTLRIDGRPARSQAALAEVVAALWLTPAMDRLFTDGASSRRRFFDRLVFGFDASHASRLAAYERAMRERSRLLREGGSDPAWLTALEARMAGNGIALAAARRTTMRRLASVLGAGTGPFPGAEAGFDGGVEGLLDRMPAVDAEADLAAALAESRGRDGQAGGASHGPHRSDLVVRHGVSGAPAAQCSTGEQKALLIAMVLATARLQAGIRGAAPLLLLDEVVAHLDGDHRAALFDEIHDVGAQAWLTGTDHAVFAPLGERARYITVADGAIAAATVE